MFFKKIGLLVGAILLGHSIGHSWGLVDREVIISYLGPIMYVIDEPIYNFWSSEATHIHIEDTAFMNFLEKEIRSMKADSATNCTSFLWSSITQILFQVNDHKYYTLYLERAISGIEMEDGCQELNGEMMIFNKTLQNIVDEIVNYHEVNGKINIDTIHTIMAGRRYHSACLPPILLKKQFNKE